jgi:kinesin family member 6/9
MSGSDDHENSSWSFVTITRIRPLPSKYSERGAINYRISDGISNEYDHPFKVLELEIPEGADPGLVHNNKSGYIGFTFNEIFDEEASQDDIFHYVEGMVLDIFQGINSTVFAYGQTGSGKTYSICGGDSYQDRGLIPRTLNLVFDELAHVMTNQDNNHTTYKCLISFTEIFNESIYDLLDPNKRDLPLEEWSKIQIFENEDGLVLKNINVFEVTTEEEALNLFFMGTTNRSTSSTPMNHASSRSHAIFTIIIESEGVSGNRIITKLGKLNLVDLAGSERLYKVPETYTHTLSLPHTLALLFSPQSDNNKSMIKEGKSINLSLHFLEQVIISLREQMKKQQAVAANGNSRRKLKRSLSTPLSNFRAASNVSNGSAAHHIPYRNSLLTTVLRDSLGGNCKSCFLLTISLDSEYFEESISTLRFVFPPLASLTLLSLTLLSLTLISLCSS